MLGILGSHSDVNRENNFFSFFLFKLLSFSSAPVENVEANTKKSFRKASSTGPPTPPHLSKHALALPSLFKLTYNAKLFIIHQRRQKSMWPINFRMLNETEIFLTFLFTSFLHPISYTIIIIIIALTLCPCRDLARFCVIFMKNYPQYIFCRHRRASSSLAASTIRENSFKCAKGTRTSTNVDGWWNAVTHFRRHCRASLKTTSRDVSGMLFLFSFDDGKKKRLTSVCVHEARKSARFGTGRSERKKKAKN